MPAPSIKEWNHPLALVSDAGLCGIILQKVPLSILDKAASQEDTWDLLLRVKDLPKDVHQFCRAAKSAQYGAYRLARMARGIATPRSDWAEEYKAAMRAGHTQRMRQLEKRILIHDEMVLPGRLEAIAPAGLQSLVRAKVAAGRKRLARHMGGRKAEKFLDSGAGTAAAAGAAREKFPHEWLLITGWLRVPNGDPGLCFFSKTALAQLFHHLGFRLGEDADPKADSRDRLRRLGLVQGPTLVRQVEKRHDGVILLTLSDGSEHLFKTPVNAGGGLRCKGCLPSESGPENR